MIRLSSQNLAFASRSSSILAGYASTLEHVRRNLHLPSLVAEFWHKGMPAKAPSRDIIPASEQATERGMAFVQLIQWGVVGKRLVRPHPLTIRSRVPAKRPGGVCWKYLRFSWMLAGTSLEQRSSGRIKDREGGGLK